MKEQGQENEMDRYQDQLDQIVKSAQELPYYLQMRLIQILQQQSVEDVEKGDEGEDLPGSSIRFARVAREKAFKSGQPHLRARKEELTDEWAADIKRELNGGT